MHVKVLIITTLNAYNAITTFTFFLFSFKCKLKTRWNEMEKRLIKETRRHNERQSDRETERQRDRETER